MAGPEMHYYRQREGEVREELTRDEFCAAATDGGLSLGRPVNFRIGDVNYSYEFNVPKMTEEEYEEAKTRWLEVMKNPGPPKLLLGPDEPMPEGWSADQIERHNWMPDGGPIIFGTSWHEQWEATGFQAEDVYPPGDDGATFNVRKEPLQILMSQQLLYDLSGFDLEDYLVNGPKPQPPLTRRQRWERWKEQHKMRLARWAYYVITGDYPPPEDY